MGPDLEKLKDQTLTVFLKKRNSKAIKLEILAQKYVKELM